MWDPNPPLMHLYKQKLKIESIAYHIFQTVCLSEHIIVQFIWDNILYAEVSLQNR
jgi:hypothetical protein